MISRDFFSVANNLGDSVAFNLESDKKHEFYVAYVLGFITFYLLQKAALNGRWVATQLGDS